MNYRVLPKITDKQKEILDLVFRFRFINRKQIQTLLNHKDPKRINVWLKDLVDKNYLGRIYSHKLLENTKPAIYFLNNNGIIWVRYNKCEEYQGDDLGLDIKFVKKFYQDKTASLTFINHCITLCELYVQTKEYERNKNKDKKKKILEYNIETKTQMWINKQIDLNRDEDFNEVKQYIPDLYIEKINNPDDDKNFKATTFFLELFDPHMPRYAIKYRIQQYIKYREEETDWKMYSGSDDSFPTIMLIFPHHRKLNGLTEFINDELLRSYESANITFFLTTYQKIMAETIVGNKNIWKVIQGE